MRAGDITSDRTSRPTGCERLARLRPPGEPAGAYRWLWEVLDHGTSSYTADLAAAVTRAGQAVAGVLALAAHAHMEGRWDGLHHTALEQLFGAVRVASVADALFDAEILRLARSATDGTFDISDDRLGDLWAMADSEPDDIERAPDPTFDAWRDGVLEDANYVRDHDIDGATRGLRVAARPDIIVTNLFAAEHIADPRKARLATVIVDHIHGGPLLELVPVPALREALTNSNVRAHQLACHLDGLDDSTFTALEGLWGSWRHTYGELCAVAADIAQQPPAATGGAAAASAR